MKTFREFISMNESKYITTEEVNAFIRSLKQHKELKGLTFKVVMISDTTSQIEAKLTSKDFEDIGREFLTNSKLIMTIDKTSKGLEGKIRTDWMRGNASDSPLADKVYTA